MNIQPIKWHGGKGAFNGKLAKWIVDQMPLHDAYLESHFGGGQVLFNKPCEGIIEYANDLDSELMNFWWVLQSPMKFSSFAHHVFNTPLSEVEFQNALRRLLIKEDFNHENAVERAVCFFVKMRQSRQGLGKDFCTPTTRSRRGMNEQVSAWLSAVEGLPAAHERLSRVEVWSRSAERAIARLNRPGLLVYADPPYIHSSRSSVAMYQHEMSERAHAILLATFQSRKAVVLRENEFQALSGDEPYQSYFAASHVPFQGKFLLSGYASSLYDRFAFVNGWGCRVFNIANNASSAAQKEVKSERLWRNFD